MSDPAAGLSPTLEELFTRFREGKVTALARAISIVENEREGFEHFLHHALAVGPRAARLGLTGPPGSGKSSLLSRLASAYRRREELVGVVAVDPTSPYSGGALLGDRIRMIDLTTDPGIFIRSMATRGSLGGLAATTREVLDLMDSFGFARVLIETVGVGQNELEITTAADTVVVVLVPESGDAVQAMKAGLMEIADVFVINKSDRPGSDRVAKDIRQAIHMRAGRATHDVPAHHGVDLRRVGGKTREVTPAERRANDHAAPGAPFWEAPVLKTVAQSGEGLDQLLDAVDRHRVWLAESGEIETRRRARAGRRVRDVLDRQLRRVAWSSPEVLTRLEAGLDRILEKQATPYSVGREILEVLLAR